MDDFNRIIEKAKQIEIQLNDEKKNHKELKMKHNDILSLLEEEKRLKNSLIKEKDEISKNFSEKSKKLEEEITMQMQGIHFNHYFRLKIFINNRKNKYFKGSAHKKFGNKNG